MNPNLTQVSKPTQWKAGVSGNPNGRPVGTRQAFSAAFYRDLAEVWAAHGKDTMLHTAKTQPTTFFAVCARLIPSDVKLTVEQTYGGLDPADMRFCEPSKKAYQRPIVSHHRPFLSSSAMLSMLPRQRQSSVWKNPLKIPLLNSPKTACFRCLF